MNLVLTALSRFFPHRMRLRMLDELTRVTAEGFAVGPPSWQDISFASRRVRYAEFTAAQAAAVIQIGDEALLVATRRRLFESAERLGHALRLRLRVRDTHDALTAFRLLYKQMGIVVTMGPEGEITVERCFFSGYYTDRVCDLVSALDQGVVAGLFSGASLEFRQRLTDGSSCCCATLQTDALEPAAAVKS